MILVGELEFTDKIMAPDGFKGFLFVGEGHAGYYEYNISPYAEDAYCGDNHISSKNLSVTEFLQTIVDLDIEIGRGVFKRFDDNTGIRLKGMTEWITRTKLKSNEGLI